MDLVGCDKRKRKEGLFIHHGHRYACILSVKKKKVNKNMIIA